MAPPELEIRNLVHFYGQKKVLEIPRLEVYPDESVVIFGPNGAGKSTLLRIASLLEKPTSGRVFYHGVEACASNLLSLRRQAVLLLEKPVFFRGRVKDNLIYGLKLRGVKRRVCRQRLEEIIDLFRLGPLLDRHPEELSAGERQRVNLARGMVIKPRILFLDEPFSSLDARFREEFMAEFQEIRRRANQTVVIVTHSREEAAYMADRMVVLIAGRVAQTGNPEEIFAFPADPDVARLMGHEALVEGRVVGQENGLLRIAVANQSLYALGHHPDGQRVAVVFRPEEVILAAEKPATSVRNWFYATVTEVKSLDKVFLVHLDCGFKLKAYLTRPAVEELQVATGKKFWAGVKASSLLAHHHFFPPERVKPE
ncbi:MAG: ABC transporter ATP-binding protein [Candidatus Aminicenantales bacterium]